MMRRERLVPRILPLAAGTMILACWACSKSSSPPAIPPLQPKNIAKIVMGYYPAWKKASFNHTEINYEYLTHLAHAFTKPDSDGSLVVPEDYPYPELIEEAHRQDVRVLMSIGGWGNCEGFPGTAATPENRSRFISHVLGFVGRHDYDGVDIDWEFVSNPVERQRYYLGDHPG